MPYIVIRLKTEEMLKLMTLRGFRSRAALAKNAGIHQQHMSKIFLGQVDPTIKTLAKLCKALDCQPGELIEYIPDPVPPTQRQPAPSY